MDGVAGVQSRINEIVSRFQLPNVAGGVLGAGETSGVDELGNFATTLARAEQGPPPADGAATLNDAGVEPRQWAQDFLTRLGMPTTGENIRAVVAWQQAEGTAARYNPLATTQGGFEGATKFNSVGVKNYLTYDDGIAANVRAITNGRYANILAALRQGTSAQAVARAIKDSPWGSGDLVLRVLEAGA